MALPATKYHKSGSRALDALGNPVRRAIIEQLAVGPRAVGEIAADFPISRPAVSKHLRILRDADLVEHRADGNRNVYALAERGAADARRWLDAFWGEALARFAMLAEDTSPERRR